MSSLFSLKGKVIVITGGTGYLGSAMTEGFLEHGAKVYIASRGITEKKQFVDGLREKYSSKIEFLKMDITKIESIKDGIKYIQSKENKIDVLVNNAYYGKTGDLLTSSEQDWLDCFNGSIHATYRMTKEVLPIMLENGGGSIINIASMYGLVSPNPSIYGKSMQNNPPQYGAAKASICQFTRYLAGHFGNQNIRANCIAPGPFPNETTQKNQEFITQLSEKNPMGRIGKPEELKGIAVLLASNASSYINGQTISVDGGWTIW
ncbi:SDR family NAD(P)-dependent oxidoreductase [Lysinibacillus endophyticus]|uniref:SDR family NAD(P)-dependent oxidoreductase n=1 Tax=Ureibacillus endophyticus TaxID=1978490 RepID=UPI0020A127C3|nr:SDR family oxidoreductase [Lysinibacillus endophyticus]